MTPHLLRIEHGGPPGTGWGPSALVDPATVIAGDPKETIRTDYIDPTTQFKSAHGNAPPTRKRLRPGRATSTAWW